MEWLKVLEGLISIIAIIGAFYGAIKFIDKRIENKLQDDSFLRKVAALFRPSVVFDENGSILIDQGGMAIIDNIEIKHTEPDNLPEEIIIHPKQYLAHSPFIRSLEPEMIDITSTRGQGFIWRYKLDYISYNLSSRKHVTMKEG